MEYQLKIFVLAMLVIRNVISLTSQTPVMEGLSGIAIICFYGFVVFATIGIFFVKNYYSKKKEGQIHPDNLF